MASLRLCAVAPVRLSFRLEMPSVTRLLDASAMASALSRMAKELVEKAGPTGGVVLVGIQRRGVELAARLSGLLVGKGELPAAIGKREPGSSPMVLTSGADAQDKLTGRQKEVLNELLKGQASKEIARTLDIAEGTVKIHLAAIYRALGVRTRAEAIARLKAS